MTLASRAYAQSEFGTYCQIAKLIYFSKVALHFAQFVLPAVHQETPKSQRRTWKWCDMDRFCGMFSRETSDCILWCPVLGAAILFNLL